MANGAMRFELGLPSLPGIVGARAGIELISAVGIERIEGAVSELVETCLAGLQDLGLTIRTPVHPRHRAGIIAFEHPRADLLSTMLAAEGVDIGGYAWGLGRIDPHAYNNQDDIQRLLADLERCLYRLR
jgi:selenocysteine lyase/cysteine desulfurase